MIRHFFISLLFCLSVAASAQGQGKIDVLHYRYSIELSDKNDIVYGEARITIAAPVFTGHIEIDLVGLNSNGKGMIVDMVKRIQDGDTSILPPSSLLKPARIAQQVGDKIELIEPYDRIDPSYAKLHPTDTLMFIITYHGVPDDGLIISKNKYGHRTFFADNWPDRAHNWIPCVDDPIDKASVEFIVTAPSHYQVISNGVQIEETNLPGNKKLTHYKEDVPLPTKVMVIGVADFAVDKVADVSGVPVYSWVFPENKKEGFYDYAIAKDMLAFFINYIGPYPYKKLANVQSKTIFGGMENAGAIFYSESSVTGDRHEENLLAHEIAHQWFGDMATEKSFAHLWLSEGFATYLAHIYAEAKYGKEKFNTDMKAERDQIIGFVKTSHKPVVDSVSSYMDLLNTNSYKKGSWVLHMLRRQLGDSVFKKCIRKYYETYAGKNADTRDLQKVFETVSGKSLEKFFTQWLYTADNLHLDISWKYNISENNIAVTIKQLQPSGNFEFPLEILIQESTTSMPKRMIRTISKNSETFLFPVQSLFPLQSKPIRFEIDPDVSLLFEGSVTEGK